MSLPLLTAVTPRFEAELVTKLGSSRSVHVVRRCADLAELLGAAAAGVGRVAVVSAELRGLDRSAIRELHEHDLLVLGVHRPGDEPGERMLRRWSVPVVVPADADQALLDAALAELLDAGHAPDDATADHTTGDQDVREAADEVTTPHTAAPGEAARGRPERTPSRSQEGPDAEGRVVAVWGPVGAPGRSTVAVNLAAELAEPGQPVILADLDTYGASVAQLLAVLDEAPGVAAAARAADQGNLNPAVLSTMAPEVAPGLRVLTGMPRPDRWTELREHALADVLAACVQSVPLTVLDTGFCLEADEELSFDTAAPRRNGATLAALEAADEVVVVGAADPVSLQRLVRGLDQLAEVTDARTTVAVNRLRAGAVGRDPTRRVREALERFAGVTDVVLVADDQSGVDAAVLAGQTLREARPSSPARAGLRELATRVSGRVLTPPRGGRLARRTGSI
ncbi:AAA family ATPase [Ornithinimicrobium faecis]|uniref:AAA family ATPase n=1 Tax=Ornithinimicrobium faecis TaxID=2934158 RepID=UPI002119B1BA|nr:P-loop NTPase [Ornithinimicrobium sp. HY1745]